MTFEQMQSTMQFILEQQAQYSARLQKNEGHVTRLERAFVTLTELARNTDDRLDAVDARLNALDEYLKNQIESLHAFLQAQSEDFHARLTVQSEDFHTRLTAQSENFQARLAADRADFSARLDVSRTDFDERLAASKADVDRGWTVLKDQIAKTGQRLDRLAAIVEQYLERGN